MRRRRLESSLFWRPYFRHSSRKPKRSIKIAFISRYSPSAWLRLSSTPSGKPVRVWSHSSSRYRGRNTLTISSGLEWAFQGARVDHPGAWCETRAFRYVAGAFSLSADPLQPRHLSSSSPAQRGFVDRSERNWDDWFRDDWNRDRSSASCCPS